MLEPWFYFVFHTGVEFHHISPTLQCWNVRFWKDSPSNPLPKLLEIPSPKMGPFRNPIQLGSRIFKHWASLSNSTWHVALRMAFVGTLMLKCVAESQGMSTCQVLVKKAKANLFQTHVLEKGKKWARVIRQKRPSPFKMVLSNEACCVDFEFYMFFLMNSRWSHSPASTPHLRWSVT